MMAFLNSVGTTDSAKDLLIIAVIMGSNGSQHCLSNQVGIASSSQDFDGALEIHFLTN